MRVLWSALAVMALVGCGDSVATEPYQLPQGASDLDRTAYTFLVYAGSSVQGSKITQVRVEAADMTTVDGSLPEGDFPVTKPKIFPVTGTAVAQGNSGNTFKFVLYGPPAGTIWAKVTGVAGSSRSVGCIPTDQKHPGKSYGPTEIKVFLAPAPGPTCEIP